MRLMNLDSLTCRESDPMALEIQIAVERYERYKPSFMD
jgi:hypothetical protein